MIKRVFATLFAFALLCTAALGAGTISLSGVQQIDATTGMPLIGCKLYFYVSGTTTPQNSFRDSGLVTVHPWPLECDSSGRIPFFYLADGTIKIRLADSSGSTKIAEDGLVVVGPSSGGGGGGSVDPTAIYQTADIKVRYGIGTHSGWVRAAGRTIGSATSGATERANSDTQALWEYLCTNDTVLRATISGGYSGSCANDFGANKTIQLPDYRGRAIAGLGDMGNTATTDLTTTYCGADPTVLGQACGAQNSILVQGNLPNVNFTVNFGVGGITGGTSSSTFSGSGGALALTAPATLTATAASGGSGTAFSRVPPSRLVTVYIKL